MYHSIVQRKLTQNFDNLNKGNYEPVVMQFGPAPLHIFAGDLALGGERHSRASVREWYARLFRIFPGIRFAVRNIVIQGWPWRTAIAIQFQVSTTLEDGSAYSNEVAQFIRLEWGRIVYMELYEDTQKLRDALHIQSVAGIVEAQAAPILDSPA
ncbi:MAG: nuclear transport factor 2 family protein [Chloroflexota bacterium]